MNHTVVAVVVIKMIMHVYYLKIIRYCFYVCIFPCTRKKDNLKRGGNSKIHCRHKIKHSSIHFTGHRVNTRKGLKSKENLFAYFIF